MAIDALPEVARQPGGRRRAALEEGTSRPAAGRRVMMAKATGGQRPRGIPPVLARVLLHAIAPVIGPLFASPFSTPRDGCRPGRRARLALAARDEAHRAGLRDAVAGARQRVFDPGHYRWRMNRRARRSTDRRVLRRLSRYWRAGVIRPAGSREPTRGGGPPGGPRAPRLAQVLREALAAARDRRGLGGAR
jgi:RNA-directed DNA polymerase